MEPIRYRWDVYAKNKCPGPWRTATPGRLRRAINHALREPQERIRVEFDNGQTVIVRRK